MTPAELDALRLEILEHRSRAEKYPPPAPLPREELERLEQLAAELDEVHARHVRHRGPAMAHYARWLALQRLAGYLYRSEERRRAEAMLEALEALERAERAEIGKARWLRVGAWICRRVDEAAAKVGRRTKLVTRIDFSPSPSSAGYADVLEPDDLTTDEIEEEIQW